MKAVSAARRPQQRGRTVEETFTDNGVELVVHSVLMLLEQLHHWVVRLAEDTIHILVNLLLVQKC